MPTYNANCKKCDKTEEYTAAISQMDRVPKCPDCKGKRKRTFMGAMGGFVLKPGGVGGFYKTGGFSGGKKSA